MLGDAPTFWFVRLPVGVYCAYRAIVVDFAGQKVDRDRALGLVFLYVEHRLCHFRKCEGELGLETNSPLCSSVDLEIEPPLDVTGASFKRSL